MLNPKLVTTEKTKKKHTMTQMTYAAFVVLFSVIHGAFLWYMGEYMDVFLDDMVHFTLSSVLLTALGLMAACLIVWVVLLVATVLRGNEIGFPRWKSVVLYILPTMPRFLAILFEWQSADAWAETLAVGLWLIIALVFIYLPPDWERMRKLRKV